MTSSFRRFEILLPLRYNDGTTIPDESFGQVIVDLRVRFRTVSSESQIIRGIWEHQDQIFRDELVRVFVDVPDTPENMQFFQEFKQTLMERFQQIDIWMTSYPIQVI